MKNKIKNVKEFYNQFNFRDMVLGSNAGNPPVLLGEFFTEDINYIKEKLPQGKYVLEVGCGFGRLLKELSAVSSKVVGIDFSSFQLEQAEKELADIPSIELLLMDAAQMKFPDNMFDIVLCLNCSLGNMPGIVDKVLSEMVRVVKPGGLITIRVFENTEAVKEAQIQNYQRLGFTNIEDDGIAITTSEGFYSKRFTKNELLELCNKAGIKGGVNKDCSAGLLFTGLKS